jgi:hypothetical protein
MTTTPVIPDTPATGKLGVLLAAIVATLAAGLDPHVFGSCRPSSAAHAPSSRRSTRSRSSPCCLFVGGVIGDLDAVDACSWSGLAY